MINVYVDIMLAFSSAIQKIRYAIRMVCTLVENVRSLYNVGTIFRTADGAGISRVHLAGITGKPPHREIRKVALGAEEHVPWQHHTDALGLVRELKGRGVQIVVLETTAASVPYDQASYQFPLCLVVGNEYEGVSEKVLREADLIVSIPMSGIKVSLNVGVAFGVAAYEIVKHYQRTLSEG